MDFKNRASCPSVKNFQLVVSTPQDSQGSPRKAQEIDSEKDFLLQMGKVVVNLYLIFIYDSDNL